MKNKQKPRVPCIKCTRLTSIHPLGLCAICRSNLPKYKKRKRKYRNSLKGMKTDLLWRLTKYNKISGENLIIATKTSKKRRYSIPERGAIAAINAKGLVSTGGTKKAFKEVAMAFGMKIKGPDEKTVQNHTAEVVICAEYETTKLVTESEHIGIGIDETSTNDHRSFLEINMMGEHKKTLTTWERPLKIMELKKGHTAKDMVEEIEACISGVSNKQADLKISKKLSICDIASITYDLTSANTGQFNGLGALLQKKRKKQAGKRKITPLIEVRCVDHFSALIGNNLQKRLIEIGNIWEKEVLTPIGKKSKYSGVTQALKWLSNTLRRFPHKKPFRGFLKQQKEHVDKEAAYPPVVSANRYVTTYTMARYFLHYHKIVQGYFAQPGVNLTDKQQQMWERVKHSEILSVSKVMTNLLNTYLLPLMSIGKHIQTTKEWSNTMSILYKQARTRVKELGGSINRTTLQELDLSFPEHMPVSIKERTKIYKVESLRSVVYMFFKHQRFFLQKSLKYPNIKIRPSNRRGERLFSLVRHSLEKNKNTRAEVIDSIVKVRASDTHPTKLILQYSSLVNARKQGRERLTQATKRSEYYNNAHEWMLEQEREKEKKQNKVSDIIKYMESLGYKVRKKPPTVREMQVVLNKARAKGKIESVGNSRALVEANMRRLIKIHV